MLANDPGDGVVGTGQLELGLEAFGAEGGLLAKLDDLAFETGGSLVRTVSWTTGEFGQCRGFAWA